MFRDSSTGIRLRFRRARLHPCVGHEAKVGAIRCGTDLVPYRGGYRRPSAGPWSFHHLTDSGADDEDLYFIRQVAGDWGGKHGVGPHLDAGLLQYEAAERRIALGRGLISAG